VRSSQLSWKHRFQEIISIAENGMLAASLASLALLETGSNFLLGACAVGKGTLARRKTGRILSGLSRAALPTGTVIYANPTPRPIPLHPDPRGVGARGRRFRSTRATRRRGSMRASSGSIGTASILVARRTPRSAGGMQRAGPSVGARAQLGGAPGARREVARAIDKQLQRRADAAEARVTAVRG